MYLDIFESELDSVEQNWTNLPPLKDVDWRVNSEPSSGKLVVHTVTPPPLHILNFFTFSQISCLFCPWEFMEENSNCVASAGNNMYHCHQFYPKYPFLIH